MIRPLCKCVHCCLKYGPKQERNLDFRPYIYDEGKFEQDLPEPELSSRNEKFWSENVRPNDRMFYHQTLNSARRFARFKRDADIPDDSLDFILQSNYDHSGELFPEKTNSVVQHETLGKKTYRRLRNTRDLSPVKIEPMGHPLQIGGVKEKISPHSVKLINSGHHTQLTNPGYSRQPADGNFFNY